MVQKKFNVGNHGFRGDKILVYRDNVLQDHVLSMFIELSQYCSSYVVMHIHAQLES